VREEREAGKWVVELRGVWRDKGRKLDKCGKDGTREWREVVKEGREAGWWVFGLRGVWRDKGG
jgi:hypothetical protein